MRTIRGLGRVEGALPRSPTDRSRMTRADPGRFLPRLFRASQCLSARSRSPAAFTVQAARTIDSHVDVRFVVVRRSLLGRACRPSRRQARNDGVEHATAVVPNFETVRTSRRTGFEPRMAVARMPPPFREQQAPIRIASVGLQPPAGHPPRPATHPDRPFERSNGRGVGFRSSDRFPSGTLPGPRACAG